MFAVVGAAGAYGMPEKLTAQALSAAMAKFNFKLPAPTETAVALIERPVKVAENTKAAQASPVFDVTPEEPVVRTAPQVVTEVPAAPVAVARDRRADARAGHGGARYCRCTRDCRSRCSGCAGHRDAGCSATTVVEKPAVVAAAPVVETAPARNPFTAADPEPAPTVTASLGPIAAPEIAEQRPLIFAPMVFEAPKPADAQVLTTLPPTEVIVAAPQPAGSCCCSCRPGRDAAAGRAAGPAGQSRRRAERRSNCRRA